MPFTALSSRLAQQPRIWIDQKAWMQLWIHRLFICSHLFSISFVFIWVPFELHKWGVSFLWHDKKLNHLDDEVTKIHWKQVKNREGFVWLGQVVHASDKPPLLCLHLGRCLWLARHLQFQTLDQWKPCNPLGGKHVRIPIHWWSIPLNGLKTSWKPVTNMLKQLYKTRPVGL